ncbi:hypothetical protein BDW74DRAFT_181222 [Aspergillus multicolor]|uniref:uncharacterized protein n=1 Tax=Aspergillus multicolor TaxID=41759 RepID=UPI003CCE395D
MANPNAPNESQQPQASQYKAYNPELIDGQILPVYKTYKPDYPRNNDSHNSQEQDSTPPLEIDEEALREFRAIWACPPPPANPLDYMYNRVPQPNAHPHPNQHQNQHAPQELPSNDRAFELFIGVGPALPSQRSAPKFPGSWTSLSSSSSYQNSNDILDSGNTWALILRPMNSPAATWYLTGHTNDKVGNGYSRLEVQRPFPNAQFSESKALKLGVFNTKNLEVFRNACSSEQTKECRAFILGIVNRLADRCLVEQLARGAVERLDRFMKVEAGYTII